MYLDGAQLFPSVFQLNVCLVLSLGQSTMKLQWKSDSDILSCFVLNSVVTTKEFVLLWIVSSVRILAKHTQIYISLPTSELLRNSVQLLNSTVQHYLIIPCIDRPMKVVKINFLTSVEDSIDNG